MNVAVAVSVLPFRSPVVPSSSYLSIPPSSCSLSSPTSSVSIATEAPIPAPTPASAPALALGILPVRTDDD